MRRGGRAPIKPEPGLYRARRLIDASIRSAHLVPAMPEEERAMIHAFLKSERTTDKGLTVGTRHRVNYRRR